MKTTWINNEKMIRHNGRLFVHTEESADAICQLEWAEQILKQPAVIYQNGRNSHVVAGEILDKSEDTLLDYARFCAA